jgi:hypothetical protein
MPALPGVSQCVQYVKDGVVVVGLGCLPIQPYREPESPHADDNPQVPFANHVRPSIVAAVTSMTQSLDEDPYQRPQLMMTNLQSWWTPRQQPPYSDEEMAFVSVLDGD